MQRSYERWASPNLGRTMEFLWLGHGGYPVVMFPTSKGRFFQYEDTGLVASLAAKIDAGQLQAVCVDSYDAESWYDEFVEPAERGRRHERYDRYLVEELFPYVLTRAQRAHAGVFGCSFGAYHAANFAGRHPELVTKAVCFSGVYDLRRFLDGYWDETAYFNSPADYIANMDEAWVERLRGVEWVIATGEYDSLVEESRRFDAVLAGKGIPRHTEIWPGVFGHDWPFWIEALPRLL
ncbi:MAG: alpha/beta hydrolase-fold protein [Candidatus Baltobacteraceae bacterium]